MYAYAGMHTHIHADTYMHACMPHMPYTYIHSNGGKLNQVCVLPRTSTELSEALPLWVSGFPGKSRMRLGPRLGCRI